MGLSFGRRNVEDVNDAPRSLNRRLMREIASAGDKGLTCSVEAVAAGRGIGPLLICTTVASTRCGWTATPLG